MCIFSSFLLFVDGVHHVCTSQLYNTDIHCRCTTWTYISIANRNSFVILWFYNIFLVLHHLPFPQTPNPAAASPSRVLTSQLYNKDVHCRCTTWKYISIANRNYFFILWFYSYVFHFTSSAIPSNTKPSCRIPLKGPHVGNVNIFPYPATHSIIIIQKFCVWTKCHKALYFVCIVIIKMTTAGVHCQFGIGFTDPHEG